MDTAHTCDESAQNYVRVYAHTGLVRCDVRSVLPHRAVRVPTGGPGAGVWSPAALRHHLRLRTRLRYLKKFPVPEGAGTQHPHLRRVAVVGGFPSLRLDHHRVHAIVQTLSFAGSALMKYFAW